MTQNEKIADITSSKDVTVTIQRNGIMYLLSDGRCLGRLPDDIKYEMLTEHSATMFTERDVEKIFNMAREVSSYCDEFDPKYETFEEALQQFKKSKGK